MKKKTLIKKLINTAKLAAIAVKQVKYLNNIVGDEETKITSKKLLGKIEKIIDNVPLKKTK